MSRSARTTQNHVLDNAPWNAITGPHSQLADRAGLAGRYFRDVAPFSALADRSQQAWDDLSRIVGQGKPAILFAPEVEVPAGWHEDHRWSCYQLVAGDVNEPPPDHQLVVLGTEDVPEMLELVNATRPGPFADRTIELGTYLGSRADGRLIAMAGERMRGEGFAEVSAVCTAVEHRGKGLGAALTLAVVSHIRARGDEAFLHVANDNENALRLYLALGFTIRREVDVVFARCEEVS